jgi:hypothetical protein
MLAFNGTLVGYTGVGNAQINQTNPQGTYQLVWLNDTGRTFNGVGTASTSTGRPIATIAPRIANSASPQWTKGIPTGFGSIDNRTYFTVGSVLSGTSTRLGLRAIEFSFQGDRGSGVMLGENYYFAGGVPSCFDGQLVTELGFLHAMPGALGLASANGAGAMTSTGVYTYYVVYQYLTAKGNIVRSAASIGTITLGATDNQVTVTMNNCSCTTRQDGDDGYNPPIGIQIYRNTNGGSTFYQLLADVAVPASDPTIYSQTYLDQASDASISTLSSFPAPVFPSSGGQLEAYCPPAFQKFVVYSSRLWGIGDDRRQLWYSSVLGGDSRSSTDKVRFNDNWILYAKDIITGLEVLDDALYVFTKSQILRIRGNGPNDSGMNNDFSNFDIVASDVGCTEPRSVLATHQGIFFQSVAGIYLLMRGGEPMYVGQSVEDALATYPTIKAVSLVAAHNEIRFSCSTSETGSTGVTLVYNYNFKAWTIFDRYDTDQASATIPTVSAAVLLDGTYYWSTKFGVVYKESTTSYLDDGQWVTLTIASAWARGSGIQGWARFRQVNLLAEEKDKHDIAISVGFDGSTAYDETHTYTAMDRVTWSTPLLMAKYQIGHQKAATIRVKVNEAPPTGFAATTGQGPLLIGLQLEVGVYPRPYRTPPTQGA